jgi:hypothetical protein
MSERKFYRTVFQIEVLSKEPIGTITPLVLSKELLYGKYSGLINKIESSEISEDVLTQLLELHKTKLDFLV